MSGIPLYRKIPVEKRGFLRTLKEISEYTGWSPERLHTLMDKHGLPIAMDTRRRYFISKTLLDTWVTALATMQREERLNER